MFSGAVPLSGPELRPFLASRRNDYIYQAHLWAAVAILAHSATRALRRSETERHSPLVYLIVIPWGVFGFFMGILSVLGGITAIYNWHNGKGFGYDLYGTWVNPLVYVVLAFSAWALIKVSLIVSGMPMIARDVVTSPSDTSPYRSSRDYLS
jgi:hypothetical protein